MFDPDHSNKSIPNKTDGMTKLSEKLPSLSLNEEREVSENEEEPEVEAASEPSEGPKLAPRKPCEFSRNCYRKNPNHLRDYSHPTDPDWWNPLEREIDPDLDPRPECEYGLLCYQKNEVHRIKYSHYSIGNTKPRKRRAARAAAKSAQTISRFLMGKNSDDSEIENSSVSEHDWSDEGNDKQDEDKPKIKVAKLGQSQREFLTETKNLLRKNMF